MEPEPRPQSEGDRLGEFQPPGAQRVAQRCGGAVRIGTVPEEGRDQALEYRGSRVYSRCMGRTDLDRATAEHALRVMDELVVHQRRKVLELARRIHPGLTDEDVRNVHDYPDVYGDPIFQFEDGQLAGFIAAQIALKARLLGGMPTGGPPPSSTP